MEKVVKQWRNMIEKVWKSSGNELEETEKGYKLYEGSIEWEKDMYQEMISLFETCEYLYCYTVKKDMGDRHYIDFSHNQQEYRFVCIEGDKEIQWNLIPMKSLKELREFDKEELRWLYNTAMKLVDKIEKMPKYRVKLALRELSIKESGRFSKELQKAGINTKERRDNNAIR
jgi:hypothetical protein